MLLVAICPVLVACAEQTGAGDFSSVDEKQAAEAAHQAERSAQGFPLTMSKADFLPWLENAYEGSRWPKAYPLSVDQLWEIHVEPLARNEEILTEDTAVGAVSGALRCAWLLELIDVVQAGGDVDTTVETVRAVAKTIGPDHLPELLPQAADDAELGDIAFASQYVEANQCDYSWRN